jgi:prepilin peptidase CpaA
MHSFAWWPTLVVVAVATATDLRTRKIPNLLVLPFLVLGIGVSAWQHGWHGLGQSAAGLGLALLIYGFLFCIGGMGAGDVKLCAAIGAWIGPHQLFIALILTALAGGIMALGWAIWAGFLGDLLQGTSDLVFGWRRRESLPAGNSVGAAELGEISASEESASELRKSTFPKRKMPYAPAIAIGALLSFFAR